MYVHKTYSINNENLNIKEYKKQLKEISKINLRRSSKFNILAILGALQCTKEQSFSENMGIYIASEYGPITSVKKVLEQISNDEIVMPFDFLNINSNNVSFYVSQALNSNGKNMLLTSHDLSFEKALEIALFELETKEVDDILIGSVDESLEDIENYNKHISNTQSLFSKDTSSWLYINNIKKDAICKIDSLKIFYNIEELNKELERTQTAFINLNQYATSNLDKLNIDEDKVFLIKEKNIHSASNIVHSLKNTKEKLFHIAMDKNHKSYLVEFTK